MEALLGLILLAVAAVVLAAPVLAIVALVRTSQLAAGMAGLGHDVSELEGRLRRMAQARPVEPPAPAPTPVEPVVPAAPAPARPAPPPPRREPAAPAPARTVPAVSPPPPARSPRPATPIRGPVPAPAPGYDWESLLGLKGAAWLGGVALVIASLFFAKWAIDRVLITPQMRIGTLVAVGLGAVAWAEVNLRRGFTTTANAVSGAGIAILYVAFFAAHSLYQLFPLGLTFALLALTTAGAVALAVRYDAFFTAVLGLVGGFATPPLLYGDVDRPLSLFTYVLLLNVGLLAVARRQGWGELGFLALGGTVFIEAGWFAEFMAPEKSAVGLGSFLVLGLVYLVFLCADEEDESHPVLRTAAILGGLAPFVFALILAGAPVYTGQWPLLFGYVGLLDAALLAIALWRGRPSLLIAGAAATGLMLPLWAATGLRPEGVWGPTLAAIALTALLNLAPRLARVWDGLGRHDPRLLEAAGLLSGSGLGMFALVSAFRVGESHPWAFVVLLSALVAVYLERTGPRRLPAACVLGAVGLAALGQLWFFASTGPGDVGRNLCVPVVLSTVLAMVALRRGRGRLTESEDEAAAKVASAIGLLGLFGCLASTALGTDPTPLFLSLAVYALVLVTSSIRRDWVGLLPLVLAAVASFVTLWQNVHFRLEHWPVALGGCTAFGLAFLALPFLGPRDVTRRWRERPSVWVTSALSGPAFFPALYGLATRLWGDQWIGALPVVQAGATTLALLAVNRRFPADLTDGHAARLRLRYLALFASVALGFVALAVPLQLDRQWVVLGWALQGLAVIALFGRLPHPGLKYFAALLFAGVGLRLLLMPDVLRFEERGLPIFNWLLYTYGVPAACCLLGGAWLRRAERRRGDHPEADLLVGDRVLLAPALSFLGLLLTFWLLNLEVFDFFSAGRYIELSLSRAFERDLTLSLAWGLYAMGLLVLGLWRARPALRFISLGFLVLTVAKVFLYDLSALTGMYRILSFLGLGISLILVSLLYQRFVVQREAMS